MNKDTSPPSWISPRERDAWERYNWAWTALLVAGLIFGLALAQRDKGLDTGSQVWIIALSAGFLIWHFGAFRLFRRFGHFRENHLFAIVYIAGLIGLWFALVRIHPAFYITQMGVWSQVFIALPIRWAIGFALTLFGLNFYQQTVGVGKPVEWGALLMWLGFTIIGILFGGWIHLIIRQSYERKRLIEELEAMQANLAQSERAAGQLAERQRLAHEIHDTLAQGFVSIIMHLESAEPHLDKADAALVRHIAQAKQAARDNLKQVRRVVDELRPEPLEQAALPEAIQFVVQKWGEQTETATAVTITGFPIQLPAEAEVTLYRATQEALSNIRKHARATAVQITLSYMQDVIILDVHDNGVGLAHNNSPNNRTGGYGITAMRERVAQFNGSVQLESEPYQGTTLVVSLPMESKA